MLIVQILTKKPSEEIYALGTGTIIYHSEKN